MTTTQTDSVHAHDHKKPHLVTISLNGTKREIGGGRYSGRQLKLALGIPVEHELDRVIHGELKPIENDEHVTIHGGEEFVSHCGQGASS